MKLRIALAACAFVAMACVIAWYVWPALLLRAASQELDQRYAQFRPFSYRWVGAPLATTQRLNEENCKAIPDEKLAHALLGIARAEKRSGRTARSLQLAGRASLLLCDPAEAIPKYKLALLLEPDNPSLNLELGIAFALDADKDPQLDREGALDYEAALEFVLRAGRHTHSSELLFDSGLLFEAAQLPNQALEFWAQAEQAESSPQWRAETNNRLAELDRRIQGRQQRMSALTGSPDSFLAHPEEAHEGAELALGAAIETWLPQMYDSRVSKLALERLGSILSSDHHDRWLQDVLKTKPSNKARDAFRNLALSADANLKGEHLRAAALAQNAEEAFIATNNIAGMLRTRIEMAYSLDRRSQPDDCLSALEGIRSDAAHRRYTWIEAQARLEEITCRTRKRQEDVIKLRREAHDWITTQTGYEGLRLRALGFMNEEYVSADSRLALWRRGEQGLRSFWSHSLPALRGYSLYSTLATAAHNAGDREAAMALLREGTLLLNGTNIIAIRALLLSGLGSWQLESGLIREADSTFEQMKSAFRLLDPAEGAGFRQEADITYAQALIRSGRIPEGLALLQRFTNGLPWPYSQLDSNVRRALLPVLGNVYLGLNDLQDACKHYLQAIVENQKNMEKVSDRGQRDSAVREIEPAWRGLTEVNLRLNRHEEALAAWEGFRSARSMNPSINSSMCLDTAPLKLPRPPQGTAFLVYAFLPGGLSAWLVDANGIEQYTVNAQLVRESADRFAELVATQVSPMDAVSKAARDLYHLLLQPFEDRLPQNGTLIIDAEGVLASIPWSALEDHNGRPVLERFATSQSIGWAEGLTFSEENVNLSKALIFGPPTLESDLAAHYPPPPDASRQAERLHRRFGYSLLFKGADANKHSFLAHSQNSTLFHFAGHGISYGGFGALLLAPSPQGQYFTADEITGLNLHSMQLVVLSACSAGVGERSGVVNLDSLVRAFLEAGAHRVVAANWDVNSALTADLMWTFYDRLASGDHPAEALRQAQITLRRNNPHAYYWAGFQVFGAP
jgi:CHAT domain-containing protein